MQLAITFFSYDLSYFATQLALLVYQLCLVFPFDLILFFNFGSMDNATLCGVRIFG